MSVLSASGSRKAPSSLAMPKRLARKPSTASLTPAARNTANASNISPDAIAQTMTGTERMRASVMRLGMLTPGPDEVETSQIDRQRGLAKRHMGALVNAGLGADGESSACGRRARKRTPTRSPFQPFQLQALRRVRFQRRSRAPHHEWTKDSSPHDPQARCYPHLGPRVQHGGVDRCHQG